MKKTYNSPELDVIKADERDVITTSKGDTPMVDAFSSFEW